jgi:hypothetical protein
MENGAYLVRKPIRDACSIDLQCHNRIRLGGVDHIGGAIQSISGDGVGCNSAGELVIALTKESGVSTVDSGSDGGP